VPTIFLQRQILPNAEMLSVGTLRFTPYR
jgi:hypothetical protein